MSVLIKGMKMPNSCYDCTFAKWSNLYQTTACNCGSYYFKPCFEDYSEEVYDRRADFCPLVEVPVPHGRLIDADALAKNTILCVTHPPYITATDIKDAPTIIESEEGDDE